MSIPSNPLPPDEPQLAPELASELPQPTLQPQVAVASAKSEENPPWTFWDVLLLVIVAIVLMGIVFPLVAMVFFGTTHIFGYNLDLFSSRSALEKFSYDPRVALPLQLLSYVLLLLLMVWIVRERTGAKRNFFQSLRWRWPGSVWPSFVLAGAVLAIAIQFASARLPIPHSLPIDKYFETATYAYLMAAFGILVAPFMEELFFRGFLYPSLARGFETIAELFLANPLYRRDLMVSAAIFLMAETFILVRHMRLGFFWATMLLMFAVGAVRTLVRVREPSLAAGVLLANHRPSARAFGISAGIFLTAVAFMLVHGAQLGFSWAALLLMFIVGLVLTLVRARLQSLAASVLIHVSYNATIFITVFAGTGGFRHMERL